MTDKSFFNELHRAQARSDVAHLTCDLEDYFEFNQDVAGLLTYQGVDGGNFNAVMDAHWNDPDRGLAYLALAMAKYDDPAFLGVLSAGLLEDLLRDPTEEVLGRLLRKPARRLGSGGCSRGFGCTRLPKEPVRRLNAR